MHSCMKCCRMLIKEAQSVSVHLCKECYKELRSIGMPKPEAQTCLYCGMILSDERDTCPRCGQEVQDENPKGNP